MATGSNNSKMASRVNSMYYSTDGVYATYVTALKHGIIRMNDTEIKG